jgi:hypothetical protein
MKHLVQAFSIEQDTLSEEELGQFLAIDEVDLIFDSLPQIQPPASLIENIMVAVAKLPVPEIPKDLRLWDHLEMLQVEVTNERLC